MPSEENSVEVRLGNIEYGLTKLEAAVQKLAEAMVQVARLEVQLAHNGEAVQRAFTTIERLVQRLDHHESAADARMRALEDAAPINKITSGWVLAWVAGAVGLIGGVIGLVGGAMVMKALGL